MSTILQEDHVFNNEVEFCRVYSKESKKQLENLFLAHRISYYIDWQDRGWLQRLFGMGKERLLCTIRINKADIEQARALAETVEGVRIRDFSDCKNRKKE